MCESLSGPNPDTDIVNNFIITFPVHAHYELSISLTLRMKVLHVK